MCTSQDDYVEFLLASFMEADDQQQKECWQESMVSYLEEDTERFIEYNGSTSSLQGEARDKVKNALDEAIRKSLNTFDPERSNFRSWLYRQRCWARSDFWRALGKDPRFVGLTPTNDDEALPLDIADANTSELADENLQDLMAQANAIFMPAELSSLFVQGDPFVGNKADNIATCLFTKRKAFRGFGEGPSQYDIVEHATRNRFDVFTRRAHWMNLAHAIPSEAPSGVNQ